MTGSVTFTDESKEHSVRRKAEYDDKNLHDLVLTLDKRGGGQMTIPLLKNARSNIEWEDHQENTLLRVKPLAELTSTLPVSTGYGAPVYQGKGVALLRPGYLYVFRGDALWRELEVDTAGQVSDVDLASVRASTPSASSTRRHAEGEWLSDILVPVFLQGSAVMHETRMAYSEVQWDWNYIQRLESDSSSRDARTTGIGHAWATTTVDSLNFESGFPASRIADVNGLRVRDLGIELMLESPTDFLPGFEYLAETELYVKLSNRIRQNQEDSDDPVDLELTCDSSEDVLARFREQKGLVCVALPDPLFQLRHSLAQLHLALHYLDAVDVSIQHNPMAHSAMLIRQAVFDPASDGSASALSSYANAIDRKKLDEVLDAAEKDHAVRIIDDHVAKVSALMKGSMLTATLDDYRECSDLAICEAYLLISDALDVLQQIPGVLKAQGIASKNRILSVLKAWVTDEAFLIAWAPEEDGESGPLDTTEHSPFNKLAQLARNQTEIDDGLLERLNLQSLVYLEKQINEKESGNDILKEVAGAGRISSLVSGSLGRWSTAILTVCKRLIEEGAIQKIEIQRVMQAAASNFVLSDPDLKGIEVMDRAGAVAKGSILGVSGGGIHRGLTDFDRSDGVLTRAKDYLCADFLDDSNEAMASTSPVRAADALEETIHKSAGGAVVFFSPKGHPEVEKLSLAKVDFAKRVGKVVDGPAVSRGLVVLAAFNVFVELNHLNDAYQQGTESFTLAASKVVGGAADLFAASLKLSTVLGEGAGKNAGGYALASRPLFDMKGWTFIGSRLSALRAATLVRTVGLASFLAGGIGVGLSFWEMRISLANKDFDAATGHAIAMTGGLVFLASPMMATLLAIPGLGWEVLGM
ncbi:MAG: toxin VasX [Marinobacter sp.]